MSACEPRRRSVRCERDFLSGRGQQPRGERLRSIQRPQPWEWEAVEAAATDAAEAAFAARKQVRSEIVLLGLLGVVAGLLAAVFPLTPGFSAADTTAAVVVASVTAAASVVLVLSR